MKLVIDVHDGDDGARVAGVGFDDWGAAEPLRSVMSRIGRLPRLEKGQPDLRRVPGILQMLQEHRLEPELILIDGLVHLDAQETPGPGQHLFHALGGRVPVIGLSKSAVPGLAEQFEVMREEEARPVIVTCAGIDLGAAKARVRALHGRKRIPTLLKLATRIAKGNAEA